MKILLVVNCYFRMLIIFHAFVMQKKNTLYSVFILILSLIINRKPRIYNYEKRDC